MKITKMWPLPLIILGTVLAVFGSKTFPCSCVTSTLCRCTGSASYELNMIGLVTSIVFTYVFVFLSIRVKRIEEIINNSM